MSFAVRGHARDRKPNLLFLMADDHARYVLRCEGNGRAVTPNLDRLAAEGSAVWAPLLQLSRLHTLPPVHFHGDSCRHAAGVTVLSTPLSEEKPTLAKQLAEAGYQTAVFGKMHFNRPGRPGLHGLATAVTEDVVMQQWKAEAPAQTVPSGIHTKPPWHPFKDPASVWLNSDKLPYPRYYEGMRSTWVVEQASKYLEDHKDSPFRALGESLRSALAL